MPARQTSLFVCNVSVCVRRRRRFGVLGVILRELFVTAIYLDDAAVITEPAVSRQRSQLAVVIPFTAMEVHHIAVQFKAMQKHSPCRAFPSDATVRIGTGRAQAAFADADVSLVFYFSGDLTAHLVGDFHGPTIQRTLQELWDGLGVLSQCFGGGLRFFSANLSAAPRDGNSDSSCSMFYSLFGLLEPQFDHFFLMEPDVFPVQPFWLDAIVRERSPVMRGPNGVRCEVWQKGSVARCSPDYADNKLRMDFHINGNALYCLNDLAFSDFRNRLRAFYPASQKYLAPGLPVALLCANFYPLQVVEHQIASKAVLITPSFGFDRTPATLPTL